MASEFTNSSFISCDISYPRKEVGSEHDSIFSSNNGKSSKTSKWHRRLFKRANKELLSNSYHRFDDLRDSDYPFLFTDFDLTLNIEGSNFSSSDWSLASTNSQSSNDSTYSNTSTEQGENCHIQNSKQQKKNSTRKLKRWTQQRNTIVISVP